LLTALLPSLIGCVPIDFSSMHPRRKYCGALQPADKVSYLPIRWLLALISCRLSVACAISVFSLTLNWRCVPKSLRYVRSVLLPFDNYEAYVDLRQTTWYSRSSWRWCFPGLYDYGSAILAGLQKQLMDSLHSVQNAAARLIFKACRQDHIQPLLRRLYRLQMPERISFRLAVLMYRCLHGSVPGYLASDLQHVSHLNARRRLRVVSSTTSIIGDRTFPATAASVWNSRLESVRSSPCHCKFSAADWKPNFLPGLTVMTNNVSLYRLLLRDFTV